MSESKWVRANEWEQMSESKWVRVSEWEQVSESKWVRAFEWEQMSETKRVTSIEWEWEKIDVFIWSFVNYLLWIVLLIGTVMVVNLLLIVFIK